MTRKMLIDAAHAEETRVVVLDGTRVEEFDFESQARKQLRGNIYLAKVTRVEPSLQAAFVEYGGNRHGFLAFNEIHPDYYQIPHADREALMREVAEEGGDENGHGNGHAQAGADEDGESVGGLEDEVDNHWGMLFKAAILSTLLSVGSEAGTRTRLSALRLGRTRVRVWTRLRAFNR